MSIPEPPTEPRPVTAGGPPPAEATRPAQTAPPTEAEKPAQTAPPGTGAAANPTARRATGPARSAGPAVQPPSGRDLTQLKQLRILSTVLLAFGLAQAGLGAGYLDNVQWLLIAHATNAFAVIVLAVLSTIFGYNYRRSGGPRWAFYLPLVIVVAVAGQITLGFAGVRGFHVFLGVLVLCAVTAFCSYAWRHRPSPL